VRFALVRATIGPMLRSVGVGVAVLLAPLVGSACASGSGYDAAHPRYRDCGWSVTWRDTEYLGLWYILSEKTSPRSASDLIPVHPVTRLGTGYAPECPGDPTGTPVDVYSIHGVDPQVAVVTRDHLLGVAKGHSVSAQLLKHP
jgi:hypothetical protein